MGLCRFDRRAGGDVISGGNGGWLGFEEGEDTGDGEVAGEAEVSSVGDMTAAMIGTCACENRWAGQEWCQKLCFDRWAKTGGSLPASFGSHQRWEWPRLRKSTE